jgi:putative chromate ion transporter
MIPTGQPASPDDLSAPPPPTLAQALRFWLRLGCISFGGPAGQISMMHTELVERRRWISEGRYLHALNYCMLLPGPEAQQLATYLGWLLHGTRGGIAAGALFVLPSLLLLIALSWVYMALGQTPAVAGVLWGIKPAVTAIVLAAAWRIGKRMSLAALARTVNDGQNKMLCGVAHLSAIERGKHPSVALALRLPEVTKLSLDALLRRDAPANPEPPE